MAIIDLLRGELGINSILIELPRNMRIVCLWLVRGRVTKKYFVICVTRCGFSCHYILVIYIDCFDYGCYNTRIYKGLRLIL